MLNKLAPYIKSLEPIPHELMLEAFNQSGDLERDSGRRKVADELMPDAGTYLYPFYLSLFIRGDMSEEVAHVAIRERKEFIARATTLIPSLLSLFEVTDEQHLQSILNQLETYCVEFPTTRRLPHEKRARKEAIRGVATIAKTIAALDEALERYGQHISIRYDHHIEAILPNRRHDLGGAYDTLRNDLRCLAFAADVVLYKESIGDSDLILSNNKTKREAVQVIYGISVWLGRPVFVTTPGSDFSAACSLLYEMASGEADVSLAGAINAFARSKKRTEMDEEERSFQWDNSDEGMKQYEADNFRSVREMTARLEKEYAFWNDMRRSRDWNPSTRTQIVERMRHIKDQHERAVLENGPHLVWADQIMRSYGIDDTAQSIGRLLETEVRLGEVRRRIQRD